MTREHPPSEHEVTEETSHHQASMRSQRKSATETFKHRSEEHTSELQSRLHLVCRLLLEKKTLPGRRARERLEVADQMRLVVVAHLVCDRRPRHVARIRGPRGNRPPASSLGTLDPGELLHRHTYVRGELPREVLARDSDAIHQRADTNVPIGRHNVSHGHTQAGGNARRRPEPSPGEGKDKGYALSVRHRGPDALEVGGGIRIDEIVLDALVQEL